MSLTAVNSNGVSPEVIDALVALRWDPTDRATDLWFDMAVSRRDAEYIVECLRVFLQQEIIAQPITVDFSDDEITDEAIDVFAGFLRTSPCHLKALFLARLPSRQVHRLLTALHTNTSIKELNFYNLQGYQVASWIADLLRHKTDITNLSFYYCPFSLTQILPLLRGQPHLKKLEVRGCPFNNDTLIFNDLECTQLFMDNILLSPSTVLKRVVLSCCGAVSMENRPLMAAFYKNTTVVKLIISYNIDEDDAFRCFIDPILRRNRYLDCVHDMLLGARTTSTRSLLHITSSSNLPPIPPPCGLWPTVLSKVGQGTQGASPVFTIFRDRLVTWIEPFSKHQRGTLQVSKNEIQSQEKEEEKQDDEPFFAAKTMSLTRDEDAEEDHGLDADDRATTTASSINSSVGYQSCGAEGSDMVMVPVATSSVTSAANRQTFNTQNRQPAASTCSSSGTKRAAPPATTTEITASSSKKPKESDML